MSITAFNFGEWLPDLPELGNPGLLEALNVLPVDTSYLPYLPLATTGNAVTANGVPVAGYIGRFGSFEEIVIFANATSGGVGRFYEWTSGSGSFIARSTTYGATVTVDFAQFDDLMIGTSIGTGPVCKTATATTSSWVPLTAAAPLALVGTHVGVVNRFVVIGQAANTASTSPNQIQWSAIDTPQSWPTPNSATAVATQAGTQFFDANYGVVTGIGSGDQFGIVFQQLATRRMTYVGPPVVFQFDMIDDQHGAFFEFATIRVGALTYFISRNGFCVTDGVTVKNISSKKIWRAFLADAPSILTVQAYNYRVRVGHNAERNLIYWCYPSAAASPSVEPDRMIIYNYREDRWTRASDQTQFIFSSNVLEFNSGPYGLFGSKFGRFEGTPGTATLITGEVEPNPGGCAYINGIKTVIASTGTAPTVGVQVGSRDDQGAAVTYATTIAPTSRTGFADFRADNRYHRARVFITGDFQKAQGIEVDATASGGL